MAVQIQTSSNSRASITPAARHLGNALRGEFSDLAFRYACAWTVGERRAIVREGALRLVKSKYAAAALRPMQKRDYKSVVIAGMAMFGALPPGPDIVTFSEEATEILSKNAVTGAKIVVTGAAVATEVTSAGGALTASGAVAAILSLSPAMAIGVVVVIVIVIVMIINHLFGHPFW